MSIGTRIKQLRTKKGISQEYMAEVLVVSQSKYSRFESGIAALDWNVIPNLTKVLEVSYDELFDFQEKEDFLIADQILNTSIQNLVESQKVLSDLEKAYRELLIKKDQAYQAVIKEKDDNIEKLLQIIQQS